jgi:hypothetical protein
MWNRRCIVWAGIAIVLIAHAAPLLAQECPAPLGRYERGWSQAVAANGNGFVFGDGSALVILDDDGTAIEFEIGATVSDLEVVDDYIYVVGEGGLRIIDLLAPDGPSVVGRCPLPGVAVSVEVIDGLAYVAGGEWGMRVVDVSVASDPVEVGVIDTDGWAADAAVAPINGGPVAVIADSLFWGLDVVDAADPRALELIAEFQGYTCSSVETVGSIAYTTDWVGGGLLVVDISNPAEPEDVGHLSLNNVDEPGALAVEGGYAYVAGKYFYVIDISDPEAPREVVEIEEFHGGEDVAVVDRQVAVAAGDTVRFIDATNPEEPVEGEPWRVGSLPPQSGGITATESHVVGFSREKTVIPTGTDPTPGFRIFDVADPAHPVQVGVGLSEFAIGDAKAVGDLVYAVTREGRFRVVDLTDVSRPRPIGSNQLPTGWFYNAPFVGVDVDGDLAVVNGPVGMVVVDITDPTRPTQLGDLAGPFSQVKLVGERAFVADGGTIRLVDLSTAWNPYVVDDDRYRIELPGEVRDFELADGHAFIAAGETLSVVDVGTEAGWTEIGAAPVGGGPWSTFVEDLSLADDQVVLVVEDWWPESPHGGVLIVFDISDPTDPRKIADTVIPGEEHAVLFDGDKIYVTDSHAGLAVYDGWPCRSGPAEPSEEYASATE